MATRKIGKFKFNLSRKGLAFRFGEGEIHKIPFGKSGQTGEDYAKYRADDPGADDGYEYEGGSFRDEAEMNGFGEEPYEEWNDGRADEYDAPDDYDARDYDRRRDTEADDYYDRRDYDGEEGYEDENPDGFFGFVETHLWLIPVLLVVLPPLGIYLAVRFRWAQPLIRFIAVGVSAVWCLFLLWLLLWHLPSSCAGTKDQNAVMPMVLTTASPTVSPTPFMAKTPAPTSELQALLAATPSPTPLTSAVSTEQTDMGTTENPSYVYSPQTGAYYHMDKNCSKIDASVSVTQVTLEAAKNRNQSACPLCCGGTIYYATPNGKNYHTNRTCQGMTNAVEYSKEAAEAEGKTACPTCAGGKTQAQVNASKSQAQIYAESITNDRSGVKVWMTNNGKAYHMDQHCQGMSGAYETKLLKALQSGKPACSICCAALNKIVYGTSSGKYYHTNTTCTNMRNAKSVTLAAALVLGKKRCPTCVPDSLYTDTADGSEVAVSEAFVYGTSNGKYYHTNPSCGGMTNPSKVTLSAALKAGRPACPTCCANAELTVYAATGNSYYHSYASCSGMKNAKSGTLAKAVSIGLRACPRCWNSSGQPQKETAASTSSGSAASSGSSASSSAAAPSVSDDGNEGYSGVYVYASEDGKYYHAKKNCPVVEDGAQKALLELVMDDGKKPCPNCASFANDKVYGAQGNRFFHKSSSCEQLANASIKSGTVVKALLNGLTACPACYASGANEASVTKVTTGAGGKYVSGASGITVYASTEDRRYHMKTTCSGLGGEPVRCTLETALNYSRTACPVCASSAKRTVYASKSGKYFHYSSSCAGSGAISGQLDAGLAYGLKACPNCVTNMGSGEAVDVGLIVNATPAPTSGSSYRFTSGKSGIKVYASVSSENYHTRSSCDVTDPMYVTLEAAMNYGKTACPKCAKLAKATVYGVAKTMIFHASSACAGEGSIKGSLDEALAYGMKPCQVCIGQASSSSGLEMDEPVSSGEQEITSASGSTLVYVDISGSWSVYHSKSSCPKSGMSGGEAVTLSFARDFGLTPCTKCNPPSRIE